LSFTGRKEFSCPLLREKASFEHGIGKPDISLISYALSRIPPELSVRHNLN